MKNLTIHRLAFSVLMMCVLAFSVQGVADALTFGTSRSGDLQMVNTGDDFTISFSTSLRGATIKPGYKRTPSTATDETPVTISPANSYYEDTGETGYQSETQVSYSAAHNYDQEAVQISVSEATLKRVGNFDVTETTHDLAEGGQNAAQLRSGTTRVTLTAPAAGATVTITISDETPTADLPNGVADQAADITFTVYVVAAPAATVNPPTLGTAPFFGGDTPRAITSSGTGPVVTTITDNIPVTYQVTGSGRVYVRTSDGRVGAKTNKLTTSSSAPVVLDMNRSTNKVSVIINAVGVDPATTTSEATIIYNHATLNKISGDNPVQRGAVGTRLDFPFIIELRDANRRAIADQVITFATPSTGAELVNDPTVDEDRITEGPPYTVETDSRGRASVYLQLGTDAGENTVTAAFSGAQTVTFRATAQAESEPTSIDIVSGNNQRALTGGVVEDPLVVIVRDGNNSRIDGATVEFIATDGGTLTTPGGDDPGTIPDTPVSGTSVKVTTDNRGEASARFSTGGGTTRRNVRAQLDGTGQAVSFTINGTGTTTTNQQQQQQQQQQQGTGRDALSFNLGTTITGNTGDQINLEARARDRDGFNVPQVPVTFTISDSDAGTLSATSVNTNSNGVAAITLTLGDEDGTVRASASRYDSVTASITITPAPSGLEVVSGNDQNGDPGSTLSSAFVVRFEDTEGNPISGAEITFTVETGGGSLSSSTDTTDSDGEAETTLTLGSVGMRNTVRASVDSTAYPNVGSTVFTAEATLGPEAIVIAGGDDQTGQVDRLLDEDLSVQVVDRDDNGVSGVLVRFRITEGRGRLSRNSDRTDPDGYAEIGFTPTTDGEVVVEAYATGLTSAFFTINTGEPPSDIVKVSGDNQSGRPGARLANPLVVEVVDENDDPVSGVTVAFRVTAGGGSVSPASATTNNNGRAQTRLTLGDDPGENTVVASVSGLSDRVTFKATSGMQVHLAASRRPVMYWISGAEGKLYRLAGDAVESLAPNLTGITNIAVDAANNVLYLSVQTGPNKGEIRRATLDGGNVRTLKQITAVPRGITVDSTGDTLYWANSRGRIQSMPTAGSAKLTNVLENLRNPTIVISNGHLYWTESIGRIRRISLTDTQRTIQNIATGLGEPLGLSVAKGKVYWIERAAGGGGSLNRSNLDGSNRQSLKTFASGVPTSLAVDSGDNKIYWTKGAGKLQRSNLAGKFVRDVASGLMGPRGIALSVSVSDGTPVRSSPGGPDTEQANNPQTTYSVYDINEDGAVNNADTRAVAADVGNSGAAIKNKRADVDGSGTVDVTDLILVLGNLDDDVAAPAIDVDVKALDVDFDRVQEQVETLLASGDRSIAAQRALLYLQHLLASARPDETVLLANYPNPFNPETWIPYHLSDSTEVRVNIYDAQGVLVRELILGHQTAGYYTSRSRAAYWDGKNALGERVASGIYFYQLQTDAVSPMRKMVILK